jgi:hypothetical protein
MTVYLADPSTSSRLICYVNFITCDVWVSGRWMWTVSNKSGKQESFIHPSCLNYNHFYVFTCHSCSQDTMRLHSYGGCPTFPPNTHKKAHNLVGSPQAKIPFGDTGLDGRTIPYLAEHTTKMTLFLCWTITTLRCIFCLIKHHAMKTYWGSGAIVPHILNLGTRWRWVVNFTPRPL